MHYFITGASGYIGSVCTEKALAEGHTVHGLSRTEAGDAKLKALGAIPIRGGLSSLDILESESAKADVVIHCAFIHDFSGKTPWGEILQADREAVDAIAKGLKGSNKALVISSGCAAVTTDPDGGEVDETAPISQDSPFAFRMLCEQNAMAKAKDGIRVSSIRLGPYVYGRGGQGFTAMLIAKAAALGESLYVGEGGTRTTTLHVDDAANLHLAAAKHAIGAIFNGSGQTTVTAKDMAQAIGKLLNVPVRSISQGEAMQEDKIGPFLTMITTLECRASNKKAREEFGWAPTGVDWVTDITEGSYKELAATLKSQNK